MADDQKPDDKITPPPVEQPKPDAPQTASARRPSNASATPVITVEPVTPLEIVAVVAWTALADLLIFRSLGFCGPAVFFALVPLVFSILQPKLIRKHFALLVIGLLIMVVSRLIWQGSSLAIFSAGALVIGLAMSAAGVTPLVMEGASLTARCAIDGAARLSEYSLPRRVHRSAQTHSNSLALLIPAAALIVFGSIFVFANPNLFSWVSSELTWVSNIVLNWVQGISIFELPFCLAALLVGIGLMRPARPLPHVGPAGNKLKIIPGQEPSTWYPAFRNTLITLIGLFAVYLLFEFAKLWTRDFPDGFYYAGYAHQGAAWLTFALGLATALLWIAVKPISDEGFFPLLRLTDADDSIIREGTKALLAQQQEKLRQEELRQEKLQAKSQRHWTEFQGSKNRLADTLKDQQDNWQKYKDLALRNEAIKRFKDHAMQWY